MLYLTWKFNGPIRKCIIHVSWLFYAIMKTEVMLLDCLFPGGDGSFFFDQRVAANWRWTRCCRISLRFNNRTTQTSWSTGRWKWKVRIIIIFLWNLLWTCMYVLCKRVRHDGLLVFMQQQKQFKLRPTSTGLIKTPVWSSGTSRFSCQTSDFSCSLARALANQQLT